MLGELTHAFINAANFLICQTLLQVHIIMG